MLDFFSFLLVKILFFSFVAFQSNYFKITHICIHQNDDHRIWAHVIQFFIKMSYSIYYPFVTSRKKWWLDSRFPTCPDKNSSWLTITILVLRYLELSSRSTGRRKRKTDTRKWVFTEPLLCTIYCAFTNTNSSIPHRNHGRFIDEETGSERRINLLKIIEKTDFQPL